MFNHPVDNLPQSVAELTFGFRFNQPVDKLPQSITNLAFGQHFDQCVNNLPQSLTHPSVYNSINLQIIYRTLLLILALETILINL